jgi:hypothetical protein
MLCSGELVPVSLMHSANKLCFRNGGGNFLDAFGYRNIVRRRVEIPVEESHILLGCYRTAGSNRITRFAVSVPVMALSITSKAR